MEYNKYGEEFNPEYDCPECGGELDIEYKLCGDCDYWALDGAGDIVVDRRKDK